MLLMTSDTFMGICRLVSSNDEHGDRKFVIHNESHDTAKVLSCTETALEVDHNGHTELWKPEECEERTYGYKPVY